MRQTTFNAISELLGPPTASIKYGWRWQTNGRPFAAIDKQASYGRVFTLWESGVPAGAKRWPAGQRPTSACIPTGYDRDAVQLAELQVRTMAELEAALRWIAVAPAYAPTASRQ